MTDEDNPGAPTPGPPRPWMKLGAFCLLLAAIGFCLFVLSREPATDVAPLVHYGIRIATVALCLVGWFWTQAMIGRRRLEGGAITDGIHLVSAPLHRWLGNYPRTANAVLIVSSGFIDLFGLFLIGVSVIGPTMRPFIALLIVFILRQVCQAVCALPAPPGMIWRYPGFPSLLVTYSVGTDFFFSGHTAIAVLGAIELAQISPVLGIIGGVVALLEAATVLVLRAHYTMDVVGAVAATACAVLIAGRLCG